MRSRNWSNASGLACATISLLLSSGAAAQTPAIALTDPSDAPQWETWVKAAGWRVITGAPNANPDARVLALSAAVQEAVKSGVDPARIYLAGRGGAAALVFYTISRIPDLWAAGIAIEGSPQPAVDTDRVFTANFTNVPVLWASKGEGDEALAAKLKSAGLNLQWRASGGLSAAAVLEWLGQQKREPFPSEIDCETNSPQFASCYWIHMAQFDAAERNDILPSTRLHGAQLPSLDLGGFGYKPGEPGPGVLVSFLPEKYSGPLKMGDRIVALDGRPIENAQGYLELMAKYTEARAAVATVLRGKDRVRVETFVAMPKRDNSVTARVKAQYSAAEREIQIVSRTIKEMKVTIPPHWAEDSHLFWNGLALEKIESPGCFVLTVEKELLHAARCQ
jgi:hypothetical protein